MLTVSSTLTLKDGGVLRGGGVVRPGTIVSNRDGYLDGAGLEASSLSTDLTGVHGAFSGKRTLDTAWKKRAKERAAADRAKQEELRLNEINARRKAEEAVAREQAAIAAVEENRRTGGIK